MSHQSVVLGSDGKPIAKVIDLSNLQGPVAQPDDSDVIAEAKIETITYEAESNKERTLEALKNAVSFVETVDDPEAVAFVIALVDPRVVTDGPNKGAIRTFTAMAGHTEAVLQSLFWLQNQVLSEVRTAQVAAAEQDGAGAAPTA